MSEGLRQGEENEPSMEGGQVKDQLCNVGQVTEPLGPFISTAKWGHAYFPGAVPRTYDRGSKELGIVSRSLALWEQ